MWLSQRRDDPINKPDSRALHHNYCIIWISSLWLHHFCVCQKIDIGEQFSCFSELWNIWDSVYKCWPLLLMVSLSCRLDILNWIWLGSNKSTYKQSENRWLQTPIGCQLQIWMKSMKKLKQESFKFIKAFSWELFLFITKFKWLIKTCVKFRIRIINMFVTSNGLKLIIDWFLHCIVYRINWC